MRARARYLRCSFAGHKGCDRKSRRELISLAQHNSSAMPLARSVLKRDTPGARRPFYCDTIYDCSDRLPSFPRLAYESLEFTYVAPLRNDDPRACERERETEFPCLRENLLSYSPPPPPSIIPLPLSPLPATRKIKVLGRGCEGEWNGYTKDIRKQGERGHVRKLFRILAMKFFCQLIFKKLK